MNDREQLVADYWDDHTDASFTNNSYWLANPLVARQFNLGATGGRSYPGWVEFCVDHFLARRKPLRSILTIGCGDGALDRHLASLDAADRIDGVDIAPGRIETARQLAAEAGFGGRLHYAALNAETSPFPLPRYDAIFFNSSLHHIAGLEAVLDRCRRALFPDGLLFVNEYVGPNRFDFSAMEREAMNHVFRLLPERYRVSQAAHDRGQLRTQVGLPDPAEVERVDPSEAIRSQDIPRVVERYFEVLENNAMCGSMMQFMLDGIAGNFREDDPGATAMLELLFRIEECLRAIGVIGTHFVLMVGKPRIGNC